MFYILADWNWCSKPGVLNIISTIRTAIDVIRIAVPIALIAWIIIELMKNVLNPDDKESRKKIGNRIIAAIVVFLIPTIINLTMNIVSVGRAHNEQHGYNVGECWRKAESKLRITR